MHMLVLTLGRGAKLIKHLSMQSLYYTQAGKAYTYCTTLKYAQHAQYSSIVQLTLYSSIQSLYNSQACTLYSLHNIQAFTAYTIFTSASN
jgi:hypothetical protein